MSKYCDVYIDGQNSPLRFLNDLMDFTRQLDCIVRSRSIYLSEAEVKAISKEISAELQINGVVPIPVRCKKGKNSVDIRIAVDTIFTYSLESKDRIAILVTNDSDFTHIASKLVSMGVDVYLFCTQFPFPTGYSERVKMVGPSSIAPANIETVQPDSFSIAASDGVDEAREQAPAFLKPHEVQQTRETIIGESGESIYVMSRRLKDLVKQDINRLSPCFFSAGLFLDFVQLNTGTRNWKPTKSHACVTDLVNHVFRNKDFLIPSYGEFGRSKNDGFFWFPSRAGRIVSTNLPGIRSIYGMNEDAIRELIETFSAVIGSSEDLSVRSLRDAMHMQTHVSKFLIRAVIDVLLYDPERATFSLPIDTSLQIMSLPGPVELENVFFDNYTEILSAHLTDFARDTDQRLVPAISEPYFGDRLFFRKIRELVAA